MTTSCAPQQPPHLTRAMECLRTAVDNRLEQILADSRRRWSALEPGASELWDCAQTLLSGGKRMRAILAALGASIMMDDEARLTFFSSPVAAHLGAALELYQASALVHDDVIDAAPSRRGQPASHRRLAEYHRASHWLGASQQFGERSAILLGDLLLSSSGEELGHTLAAASVITPTHALPNGEPSEQNHNHRARMTGLPALTLDRAQQVRAAFDAMTSEVALGQYLDLRSEVLPLGSYAPRGSAVHQAPEASQPAHTQAPSHLQQARAMREAALRVATYKSAHYSVMHPLLIGATLAGVDPVSPLARALARFGEQVGIAFQLRDDALGVAGQEDVTGKPVGGDLREGKRTVLLSLTWERSDEAGRELLGRILGDRTASTADIHAATQLMDRCGAMGAHETMIESYAGEGIAALAQLGALDAGVDCPHASPQAQAALLEMAQLLTARSA